VHKPHRADRRIVLTSANTSDDPKARRGAQAAQTDRLPLILSEHSMSNEAVKTEIANARQKELNYRCQVLFPVSLLDYAKNSGVDVL
jgi:hypothetical protein